MSHLIQTSPCLARFVLFLSLAALLHGRAAAAVASEPQADPVLDPPTLQCLGVYWVVRGDDNTNAAVEVAWRKAGGMDWRRGMQLFRVEKGANKMPVPPEAWLFAGSVVGLAPDTEYELKLKLSDPDGDAAEKLLPARTMAEPAEPPGQRVLHVAPGAGGGDGSPAQPFLGLAAAQSAARPGDLFLLRAGRYEGAFEVRKSGEPGKPVIWRGAGDGEAVLDGAGANACVAANGVHDIWFERLTISKSAWGLVAHEAQRIVIRRCHFRDVKRGITARRNPDGKLGGFFVADNLLEGNHPWREKVHGASVEEDRGIEISGSGNVICFNRVRNFKDGIDLAPSVRCVAADIHNNEVSDCLDDGCELDGAERNCRCFHNRFTDVFQGISVQPVHGGPVYVFRNALYNLEVEPFKMHNSPSGALFLHNTVVKKGPAIMLMTGAPVRNCFFRNNLFLGSEGRAFDSDAPMLGCDFDYDGFGGASGEIFMKWNKVRYASLADVKARAPVYRHAVLVDPAAAFASGLLPPADPRAIVEPARNDLRLKAGSSAIDAGESLPNFSDGFAGAAPDLGAYELGSELPHYGPRPEK